jgi:hypothetical protein
MGQSSNYYPQGNGLVESTNKYLVQILKKIVTTNQRDWHKKLLNALWANRITPKNSTRHSPFSLVYGKDARLPVHLELNALAISTRIEDEEGTTPMQSRFYQLMQLEEQREQALINIQKRQEVVKKYFDRGATVKDFHKDQFVLLWNKAKEKPSLHSKFDALWIGPYQIENICGFNSYLLKGMDDQVLKLSVNGQHLKHLFS